MSILRILTISTLYPNPSEPHHGIFVETRLRKLVATEKMQATVIAPVPWFPWRKGLPDRKKIPASEIRNGIRVLHPRYLAFPLIGMYANVWTLRRTVRRQIKALLGKGEEFALIDAHYFYPDGVAIAGACRDLGLTQPLVITARGTDINLIPQYKLPRRWILDAFKQASHAVAVCDALRDEMIAMGMDEQRVTTLRNGVDLQLFKPMDAKERAACREEMGLSGLVLVSVGHLIERKGHHVAIGALSQIPDATLLVVGAGPERKKLKALAERCHVEQRVRFLGAHPQSELRRIYSSADISILASSREGWANVLLESMACGTPVVATKIWGTPEVVRVPAAGNLVAERSVDAFAKAILQLSESLPQRGETRAFAEDFSWEDTIGRLATIFRELISGDAPSEGASKHKIEATDAGFQSHA